MSNVNTLSTNMQSYDYIIAGAGGAGLSLLRYLLASPKLQNKHILVIDQTLTKTNDRTWCFWEMGENEYASLVKNKWETISIHAGLFTKNLPTSPFSYKMIQGIDFYTQIIAIARSKNNVHWQEAAITKMDTVTHSDKSKEAVVFWEGGTAIGKMLFTSILPFQMSSLTSAIRFDSLNHKSNTKPFLWQHFKGRTVRFEKPVFNNKVARLMDFNVPQYGATAFMYLLPFNETEALVEYTLFSDKILELPIYDVVLNDYLNNHYPECVYTIKHEEIGAIPMTQQKFSTHSPPIYSIGAVGSAIKASTGYAFQFIQKQCKQVVTQLEMGVAIDTDVHKTRHHFYDAVLLHILFHHKMEGAAIFRKIFEKNKAATVFKFLSNTSNVFEDIQIMHSLPIRIFLPAAIKVLLRRG